MTGRAERMFGASEPEPQGAPDLVGLEAERAQRMYGPGPSRSDDAPAEAATGTSPRLSAGAAAEPTAKSPEAAPPATEAPQTTDGAEAPAETGEPADGAADGDDGDSGVPELPPAERLYDGGEPIALSVARSRLGSIFEPIAFEARYAGDDERAEAATQTHQDVAQLMTDMEVGDADARALAHAGRNYDQPAEAEAWVRQQMATEEQLVARFGDDAGKVLDAANRVAAEAIERVPGLEEWLDAGAGNDPAVIDAAINVARRKGYLR